MKAERGLAIVRIAVGAIFVAHGMQKLVVWGVAGGAPFFREVGIPLAGIAAPLVAFVELFGGTALVMGFGTRIVAGALGVVMLVALAVVHLPHGFFLPNGIEFVLTLAAACAALVVGGPGSPALDGRRGTS